MCHHRHDKHFERADGSSWSFADVTDDDINTWRAQWHARWHEHWGDHHGGRNARTAYPGPTVRQYESCKNANGSSVWTEEGIWRCLFPNSQGVDPNGKFFPDYTGYLEFKRQANALARDEREKRNEQAKLNALAQQQADKQLSDERSAQQAQQAQALAAQRQAEEARSQDRLSQIFAKAQADHAQAKARAQAQLDHPSVPTYQPADVSVEHWIGNRKVYEDQTTGKRLVGERIVTETQSRDDGSLETKRRVAKFYEEDPQNSSWSFWSK